MAPCLPLVSRSPTSTTRCSAQKKVRNGLRPDTLKKYDQAVKRFAEFYGKPLFVKDAAEGLVERFINRLEDEGKSPIYCKKVGSRIRMVLHAWLPWKFPTI